MHPSNPHEGERQSSSKNDSKVGKKNRQITKEISIVAPSNLWYLLENIKIRGRVQVQRNVITLVSNCGVKDEGGFGWVAARDDEVIAVCHGNVRGSTQQMSSFRTEASEVFSAVHLISRIARAFQTKINTALVRRVQKLIEHNPIGAYTDNDPDLYCRIKDDVK